MNIGVIIGRLGDVDGVALETEKWITVLERIGHTVYVLSGSFGEHAVDPARETLYRPLFFHSSECTWEQHRAFFSPPGDPEELLTVVQTNALAVATQIHRWVRAKQIDVMLSENASSLPCHLSLGLGIKLAAETLSIPVVAHNHDFAWERGTRYDTPFREVAELVDATFPLRLSDVRQVVINSAAVTELRQRYGLDSTVVPNVMDFERDYARKDSYNAHLLRDIGMEEHDLPLFQVTRIVKRKGIETAIDLVRRIDDPRVKLVITGSAADDNGSGHFEELQALANGSNGHSVTFAHPKILNHRHRGPDGHRVYSLEDAYASAAGVTYFSTYEGFGNAFIESVLARKPIFVNNYTPVYWPDIGSKGFRTVMIEDGNLTDEAVGEIARVVHDPGLAREIAEHNFELGKQHFSYDVLEEKLTTLFAF